MRRFEGTSLDELLAYVHRECGESAQIVEANRVRRGGVGGFFAKEGFEVVVSAEPLPEGTAPMTPEDALAQVIPTLGPTALDPHTAGTAAEPTTGARPWMRTNGTAAPTHRAAAVARALDDADGDELIGDVASALDGVRTVAAGAASAADRETELEQAIAREALATMRADRTALIPPHLRTPVAPIAPTAPTGPTAPTEAAGPTGGADPDSIDALLGLVDAANGADQREPITFAAALEQAMAEPTSARTVGPVSSARTMSLDDLLDLELSQGTPDEGSDAPIHDAPGGDALLALEAGPDPALDPRAVLDELVARYSGDETDGTDQPPAPAPAPAPADGDPVTMLAEDFIRQADARFRDGAPAAPVDPDAAAMAELLIARATSSHADPLAPTFALVEPDAAEPADLPAVEPADLPVTVEPAGVAAGPVAATAAPIETPTVPPAATPTSEPAGVAGASVVELMARYEHVPAAPDAPAGPGLILVIGDAALAHRTATHLAGPDDQVALASPEPPATVPSWSTVRTTDDVLDRVDRTQRQGERLLLAVELGTTPAGLLWAKRLIDRLPAGQVRMAVSTTAALDDVRAEIELLGRIDAIDLLRSDDAPTAPVDVEQVLGLGTPVGTVDGHPTSPALWAALTLEGATRA